MNEPTESSLSRFRAPRYWPTWVLFAVMRISARLPVGAQLWLGAAVGGIFFTLNRRERRIARRNLEICFPELAGRERERLLRRHFRSLGLSVVEMGVGWFTPIAKLHERVEIRGLEHLDAALAGGRGALLVTAHFTPIEIGVCVLEDYPGTVSSLYRPQRNAMMDWLILEGRSRFSSMQVPRDNVRLLIRLLKRNEAVLYMPDQTYLGNQSAMIPFFGEPATTNVATSKIAKISGAPVLPYWFRRNADERTYTVEIEPPLPGFPTDDALADTKRLVALLEARIREVPEQYLWAYKKFKRRPDDFGDIYS
ncbi:MAG TPA: lysophospholipid acyltransferase family protein [Gammaproteobacteria bacterium]|nr:lysophospholipid acyltransferase family protein [Gammaproteobacteria bacterium]